VIELSFSFPDNGSHEWQKLAKMVKQKDSI